MNNRIWNVRNPNQGDFKKVLCVCSAGLLRSPTAAVVLSSEPFNYNTRAVGVVDDYALVPIDVVLLEWADEVVCMHPSITDKLRRAFDADTLFGVNIVTLNIQDQYGYRDPELMDLIKFQYEKYLEEKNSVVSHEIPF
jgi:predicted protein tyrosine phosphatase